MSSVVSQSLGWNTNGDGSKADIVFRKNVVKQALYNKNETSHLGPRGVWNL